MFARIIFRNRGLQLHRLLGRAFRPYPRLEQLPGLWPRQVLRCGRRDLHALRRWLLPVFGQRGCQLHWLHSGAFCIRHWFPWLRELRCGKVRRFSESVCVRGVRGGKVSVSLRENELRRLYFRKVQFSQGVAGEHVRELRGWLCSLRRRGELLDVSHRQGHGRRKCLVQGVRGGNI